MMRRLLYLVGLLILASMPVRAQQQASSQPLTITVAPGPGAQHASRSLTLTVSAAGGPQTTSAMLSLTILHTGTLTWQRVVPSEGYAVQGYNVYRSTGGGSYVLLYTTLASVLTYVDAGLTPGITYSYEVAAVDNHGTVGPPSTPVSGTTPSP